MKEKVVGNKLKDILLTQEKTDLKENTELIDLIELVNKIINNIDDARSLVIEELADSCEISNNYED